MKRKGRKDMKGRCLAALSVMTMLCVPAFASTNAENRVDFGYGVGLDAVVYNGSTPYLDKVTVESRYDIENRETRVFAVATVDLFSLLGGK